MKLWNVSKLIFTFVLVGLTGCTLNERNSILSNKAAQTVDMGKFKGLKIIEIASINYPAATDQKQTAHLSTATDMVFSEIDMENFSDSLIQSLKRSDVRVLPSAQTKIHIDFTQLAFLDGAVSEVDTLIAMTADVAVSRNGIITRKTVDISSKIKGTIGTKKANAVKQFIQELGELLREQSSFKR